MPEVRQGFARQLARRRIAAAGLGLELGDVLAVIGDHRADEFAVELRTRHPAQPPPNSLGLGLDHVGIDPRMDLPRRRQGLVVGRGMVALESYLRRKTVVARNAPDPTGPG